MDKQYEEMAKLAISNGYSIERFQEVLAQNNFSEEQIASAVNVYNLKKKDTTPSESQGQMDSMESTQSGVEGSSSLESPSESLSQGADYLLGQQQQQIAQQALQLDLNNLPTSTPWSNIKEEEDFHRAKNDKEATIEVARRRQKELSGLNEQLKNAVTPGQKLAIGARKDEINQRYKDLTGDTKDIIDENGTFIEETTANFENEFKKVSIEVYDDIKDKALEKSEGMHSPLIGSIFNSINNMVETSGLALPDMLRQATDPTYRMVSGIAPDPTLQAKYDKLTYNQQIEQLATQYAMGIDEESVQRSITEDFKNGDIEDGIKKVSIGVAQTIPQIAFTILAPEVALPTMAATSAASTWADVQGREDLSQEQKLSLAVIAGGAEYIFERIGLDEINKARKSLGIIDELPKSTRMQRAKDWVTSKNSIAGQVVNSRAASVLGSAAGEGLEEFGVELTNQVAANLIAGEEFNPYQIADSFIVGAAAGGGTVAVPSVLAKGFSAVGSTALLKDRVRIVNEIKKFKDLAASAEMGSAERKEFELELERANMELRELVDREEVFYASMNEVDQNELLSINQKIRQKIDLHSKMSSGDAKKKIANDVQALLNEKQSIEKKYGDPYSTVVREDGTVQRKPYKDRRRAEKLNTMLNELGIGQVEETDENLADSTVEFTENTDLDALVNDFLGGITDAQLENFGTSRTEIRKAVSETKNMLKALQSINPNTKVFVHKTAKAFEQATGDSALDSSGIYLPLENGNGEIHLFGPALSAGTAFHELGHEIASQMGTGFIQEYFKAMSKAVMNDPQLAETYGVFLKQYLEDGADLSEIQEEFFAEFLQDMARGNVSVEVEQSLLNKFRQMLNKAFNLDLTTFDNKSLLVESISRMAEKIAVGADITEEAVFTSFTLEDMGVAVVNANKTEFTTKKRKRQVINAEGVQTYSMKDVVERVGGRVLIITSDNTGVGYVDEKLVQGGLFYSFFPENIRDGVGFASVDLKSVESVMNFIDTIAPNGEDVAVFIMQQSPQAMLGNFYAADFLADGMVKVLNKDNAEAVIQSIDETNRTSKAVMNTLKDIQVNPLLKGFKTIKDEETGKTKQVPKEMTPDQKYGYGKKVGNDYYMERTFMEEDMPAFVSEAAKKLPPDFEYKVVKFNDKTKDVSFIESKDFDTAAEPTVGDSYRVKANGEVKFTKGRENNKQIYHHKWLMVRPSNQAKKWSVGKGTAYKGFNYTASKQRSIIQQEVMLSQEFPTTKIGNQDFWSANVEPLINEYYIGKKIDWSRIGTWKTGKNGEDNGKIYNDFIYELRKDFSGDVKDVKGSVAKAIDKMSFKFRNELINLHMPKGYGKQKGQLVYKDTTGKKSKEGSLLKQLLTPENHSQFVFFQKYSQPEFAEMEELLSQLQDKNADWGYTYSGFITNNTLDYGKEFQEKGIKHEQFNAKIPSTENFLLDGGYQIDNRYKEILEYRDSDKKPDAVRVSIAGSMFMGTRSEKAQASIIEMTNALLGGEKEGLSTKSIIETSAKKRKRVGENKVTPKKEGSWYVSRDFEDVIKQFPDLYKESLGTEIDEAKFLKDHGVELYHGGAAFVDGKIEAGKDFSFFSSTSKKEAEYYAKEYEDGEGQLTRLFVAKEDVADEATVRSIMKELGITPMNDSSVDVTEEGMLSELIDPNFDSEFYLISDVDRNRLYKELVKRGVKAFEFEDNSFDSGYVTNYIILDPSKDAYLSIEDMAEAKDIDLNPYIDKEASGVGNETQVTTNNGTYQKMIDFFKSVDKSFKKKVFADINGGLGASHQLKYENGIENYQVIEPFYDRKRFPIYSMTMSDAAKAVKILGLKETAKPHTELNKFVKKDENFDKLEALIKKGDLPSAKLTPDYTELNGYDIPSESIDYAMSNAVLNVIPGDTRQDVVLNFGRALKVGGMGIISTRGTDVAANKSNVSLSEDPLEFYVASKYTYQKGFKPAELEAYIQDVLGPDFEVERYNKLSGPAVVVKRIDNGENLESKFVYQKEGLKPKKRMSAHKIAMISSNFENAVYDGLKRKGYSVDKVYNRNSSSTLSNYRYIIARKGSSDVRLYAMRISDHGEAGSMEIYDRPFKRVDDMNHELFKQFKRDTGMGLRFTTARVFNAYNYESYKDMLRGFENQDLGKASSIMGLWNRFSRKTVLENFVNAYKMLPEEGRDKAFEKMIYEMGFDKATAKEFTNRVAEESAKVESNAEGVGRIIFANIAQASKKNNNVILEKFFGDIEEAIKAGRKLEDILDKYKEDLRRGATKDELSVRTRAIVGKLQKNFLDRQYNIKKGVREANLEGIEDLIVTNAGSGAWSKVLFNRFEKDIYGGLNNSELDALDKIIFAKRVIQIDSNFDAREKDRPKHPLNFNKEEAEASLRSLRMSLGTDVVLELEERADKYFEAMRELFTQAYNEGLVTEKAYEALKNDDYAPRKFLNFVLNPEDGTFRNSDVSSKEFVRELNKGSDDSLIMDSRYLLQVHTRNTQNKIFTNRLISSLAEQIDGLDLDWVSNANTKDVNVGEPIDLSEPGEESFMFQPTEEKITAPDKGFVNVYYFVGGEMRAIQMKKQYRDEMLDLEILAQSQGSVEKVLGGLNTILRFNATGAGNPLFFMKDFFRNWLYAIFRSDVYGRASFTISSMRLMRDLFTAYGDKINQRQDYLDLASHGGLMDFLAIESSPYKNLLYRKSDAFGYFKRGVAKTTEGLTYMSETTETAFRVAIYKRDLKQRIKDFQEKNGHEPTSEDMEALKFASARASREILDFSQGGLMSKQLDRTLAPYMNVAIQGTKGMVDSIKNNPVKFFSFMTELGTIAAAITYLRLALGADDDDDVAEYDKRKNFIFWLGEKETVDENGNPIPPEEQKRKYLRIPKAEQLAGFLRVFEIMVEKEVKGDGAFTNWTRDDWKAVGQSFSMFLPVSDVKAFVPAWVQAMAAYGWNYDMFRDQAVAYDFGKVLPQDEGIESDRVEYFYKALGKAIGASPARMKAATEKLVTTPQNSIVVSLAYGIADAIAYGTSDLGEQVKANSKKTGVFKLFQAVNPSERFVRETNPRLRSYQEDQIGKDIEMREGSEAKMAKMKVEEFIDAYLQKEMTAEDIYSAVRSEISEPDLQKMAVAFIRKGVMRRSNGINSAHWDIYSARSAELQAYYLVKHFHEMDDIEAEVGKMRSTLSFRPAIGLRQEIEKQLNEK